MLKREAEPWRVGVTPQPPRPARFKESGGPTAAEHASVVVARRRVSTEGRGLWEEGGSETGRRGRAGQRGRGYDQEVGV